MFIVIYTVLWLLTSLGLLLFGFLVGRFARKLPVIDDALPWTLYWGEILSVGTQTEAWCGQIPRIPPRPGNIEHDDGCAAQPRI